MKIYTWVCSDCNAGWNSEDDYSLCPWCGRRAELRGVFTKVPLPFPV